MLEGIDGSGKSTQAQRLAAWARARGDTVVLTREPGGTMLGERLRALILDPDITCAPRAELLMILAARAQHVAEVIAPALHAGALVISDRFSLSSLAYQGYGRGVPLADIAAADRVATGGLRPDLTVVIDVPYDVVLARIGERRDRFEGEGCAFLERVIAGYRRLAAEDSAVSLIDGTASPDAVQNAVRHALAGCRHDNTCEGGQGS